MCDWKKSVEQPPKNLSVRSYGFDSRGHAQKNQVSQKGCFDLVGVHAQMSLRTSLTRPHNTAPQHAQRRRSDPVSPWRLDHTGGSRQDTHSARVPDRGGCGWLAHTAQVSHARQRRSTDPLMCVLSLCLWVRTPVENGLDVRGLPNRCFQCVVFCKSSCFVFLAFVGFFRMS